jgi:hypothetical protein
MKIREWQLARFALFAGNLLACAESRNPAGGDRGGIDASTIYGQEGHGAIATAEPAPLEWPLVNWTNMLPELIAFAGDDAGMYDEEGDGDAGPLDDMPLPMFGAIVVQHVSEYPAWRAAFDAALPERKRAGFVAQGVLRGVEDPQLVAVWLAVTDAPRAKLFFADTALQQTMHRGTVIGRQVVQLSSNVAAQMEPGHTGLYAALLSLVVDDFPAFKLAFATQAEERLHAGIIGYALSHDVDDTQVAYVYLQATSPAALRSYLAAKPTRQRWRDAGMRNNPAAMLVREEELRLCR